MCSDSLYRDLFVISYGILVMAHERAATVCTLTGCDCTVTVHMSALTTVRTLAHMSTYKSEAYPHVCANACTHVHAHLNKQAGTEVGPRRRLTFRVPDGVERCDGADAGVGLCPSLEQPYLFEHTRRQPTRQSRERFRHLQLRPAATVHLCARDCCRQQTPHR